MLGREIAYEEVGDGSTKDFKDKTIIRKAIDDYLNPWSITLPGGEGSAGGLSLADV